MFEKLTIGYIQYVLSNHFDIKITVSGIESYGKTVQLSFPSIEDTRDAFFCIISLIKKYNSYFDPRDKSPRVMFRMPPELEPGLREPPPPGENSYVQPSTFQALPSGGQYASYALGIPPMSSYMNNIWTIEL